MDEGVCHGLRSADTQEQGIAIGWENIQYLQQGTVSNTYWDHTLTGGPCERTEEYVAPFFKTDREADYRIVWAFFESMTII
ncbi:hypothetical protein [Salinisphaera japonica]|uniref:Uncharacterized protein n=1 Tax=Salinisphaera japonica YTM-1 TaxID=1209778 RepID=A0A423Q044_9GAMM|nr:hypothetical protein [Salinisphaera japonica]ROO31343.1 hypothetical protein SAJA_03250 [Salinisphaera japonica YTM-1]